MLERFTAPTLPLLPEAFDVTEARPILTLLNIVVKNFDAMIPMATM
jgi:hypothetical protein